MCFVFCHPSVTIVMFECNSCVLLYFVYAWCVKKIKKQIKTQKIDTLIRKNPQNQNVPS